MFDFGTARQHRSAFPIETRGQIKRLRFVPHKTPFACSKGHVLRFIAQAYMKMPCLYASVSFVLQSQAEVVVLTYMCAVSNIMSTSVV